MSDTIKQIIAEMRELTAQIAAAEINGFDNSVTHLADALESALAQEGQAVAYLRRLPDGYHSLTVRTPEQMKALDALPPETALYARPAAPVAQSGWRLVPVKANTEMFTKAWQHANDNTFRMEYGISSIESGGIITDSFCAAIYNIMVTVAPTPDGEAKK